MCRKAWYYLSHWENWHWFAKYVIIGPAWIWLCIKARSLWFFTPSNPGITFGGFQGETKKQIYDQLPSGSYPETIYVNPQQDISEVEQSVILSGLNYPIVAKPNIGMMGLMFRKIESYQHLRQYHAAMKVDYLIQEYIDHPLEVSVFYYRIPGQRKGRISGFIRKEYMEVTGDGTSTLRDLISNYQRAQFRLKELFSKHERKLADVLKQGERFILSDALNLSRGGRLVNLNHEIDDRMLKIFDQLSHWTGFFYGRYDIKCASVEELKNGNFSILEFNGCGGEAHHVYSGYSFIEACKILIEHWNILYEISKKTKIAPWTYREGREFMLASQKHFADLKKLDHSFHFEPTIEEFISERDFPCIAAKAAIAKNQVRVMVCDHVACPKDDHAITKFIYDFVDEYRKEKNMYSSAIIIFQGPTDCTEEYFDTMMWQRLQGISDHDEHPWDSSVSCNPSDPNFSFSVKGEAFYVVGLHPGSSRRARRYQYPAIVFNPHKQFEQLREKEKYSTMKDTIRKRDMVFSGSVNPMLADFGDTSEVYQYSGKAYDESWKCPFIPRNEKNRDHSAA